MRVMRQVRTTIARMNMRGEVVVFAFPNVLAKRLESPDSAAKIAIFTGTQKDQIRTGQLNLDIWEAGRSLYFLQPTYAIDAKDSHGLKEERMRRSI